jgi:predicted ester cyclase
MASPVAEIPGAIDVARTRAVLEPYLDALVARTDVAPYLTADVVLTLVEIGQEFRGRAVVAASIADLHQTTFDARPEVSNLVIGEGTAAGEFVFVGRHTGEFAGIPATGRGVRVPYTVFYDLADGKIAALRILGFASGLVAQLSAEESPKATPAS